MSTAAAAARSTPLSFISPPIHFSFKKVTQYALSPRGQNAPSISPHIVKL